jgi:hypothetical protein
MPALHKTEGGPPEQRSKRLPEYPFNEIHSPGSYLMVETGDLIRVPPEALAPGHSPMVSITSVNESRVAKLTDNPATPISVCRTVAADNDLFANF